MILLFYVHECLIFSPSKDTIYEVYASLQADLKIEDYGELNMYPGIDLELPPDGSIHLRQPEPTQIIINMIPGMDMSSAKPTPWLTPPQKKMRDIKQEKMNLITDK